MSSSTSQLAPQRAAPPSGTSPSPESEGTIESRHDHSKRPEDVASFSGKEETHSGGRRDWLRLSETIEHSEATIPLAWHSFLTGFIDAILYAHAAVWTGFQTGNVVQMSQNIAEWILPYDNRDKLEIVTRVCSLTAFFLGCVVGGHVGQLFGHKKRGWLVCSSLFQAIVMWGSAAVVLATTVEQEATLQYRPAVLAMAAFAMGMQCILSQKLSSPAFATTVAFTATLSQVASDPYLLLFSLPGSSSSNAKKTHGRNLRILGLFSLALGGGVAQSIYLSSAGFRGSMAIAASFKVLQALLWLVPAGAPSKVVETTSKA